MSVGEVLTCEEHYRSLTRSLPRLSREEEAEIVRRAKEEDAEAREQVITNCLTYIEFIAKRYEPYLHHDDYLDLVSIGSLAVVENFSRALGKDNPSGSLRAEESTRSFTTALPVQTSLSGQTIIANQCIRPA